jgi:hypothetical protein
MFVFHRLKLIDLNHDLHMNQFQTLNNLNYEQHQQLLKNELKFILFRKKTKFFQII